MNDEVAKYIRNQLTDLFVANETKGEFNKVLFELFSPKEKIMLEKRVAIVELLNMDCSTYKISRLLKVSNDTILRIESNIARGKLVTISGILKRRSNRGKILKTLEAILTFGLPGNPQQKLKKQTRRNIEKWKAGSK